MEWCWRPSRSSMTEGAAVVGAIDDDGPWLVVISLVIDRLKFDEDDDDDDGDYRPSSRCPNSGGGKLRWRLKQQTRLCLAPTAEIRLERPQRIGDDDVDDWRLIEASTVEGSFKRTATS